MNIITFRIEKNLSDQTITLYPTLIQTNQKNYLVDCGYEETFDQFVAALDIIGLSIQDLHAIILSHDDIDHLGAVHLFKSRNKALKIYCSEIEEPSISGKIKSERLIQAENSLVHLPEEYKSWATNFIQQLRSIQREEVDFTLTDNQKIENDLIVVNTPGHTKGHISLYIPSKATLIANDALVIEDGELEIANPSYTLDLSQAIVSIQRIKDLQPEKIICYHGGIISAKVQEKLDALLLKYKPKHTTVYDKPELK